MHARELIELAALFSSHHDEFISKSSADAPDSLTDYWLAIKSRHAEWTRGLASFEASLERSDSIVATSQVWHDWRPLLQEILLGEIRVRILAAASQAVDDRHGSRQWLPIAASAFDTQLDASARLLRYGSPP